MVLRNDVIRAIARSTKPDSNNASIRDRHKVCKKLPRQGQAGKLHEAGSRRLVAVHVGYASHAFCVAVCDQLRKALYLHTSLSGVIGKLRMRFPVA